MKDSAQQMRDTTAGVIEAEVEPLPGPGDDKLTLKFMLRVPALDDYRYNLFRLVKGLDDFPVELSDGGDRRVTLNTMPDLESALRELFAGEATRAIIGKLLALAEAQDP